MCFRQSPQSVPHSLLPRQWKTSFAESIQAPPHLHVYQRAFTAQWPQQALSNGRIVLQNHPKSELPASFPLAVSSVVETPVSFLGLLKPLLSPCRSLTLPVCWDVYFVGKWLNFPLSKVLRSFTWHYLIFLVTSFHFIRKRLDCQRDGRMKHTYFLLHLSL